MINSAVPYNYPGKHCCLQCQPSKQISVHALSNITAKFPSSPHAVPVRDDGNMPDVPAHPCEPQGENLEWLKKL